MNAAANRVKQTRREAFPAHASRPPVRLPCMERAEPTAPGDSGRYHVSRDAIYAWGSPTAPLLARCPREQPDRNRLSRAEREANLRLFAQAPAMYRMLEQIEAYLAASCAGKGASLLARIRTILGEVRLELDRAPPSPDNAQTQAHAGNRLNRAWRKA